MKAIDFDKANIMVAEHQDQYQTLPAYWDSEQGLFTSCWDLVEINKTGKMYLQQQVGNKAMQPIMLTVKDPI